jgi:hypothetical protein
MHNEQKLLIMGAEIDGRFLSIPLKNTLWLIYSRLRITL